MNVREMGRVDSKYVPPEADKLPKVMVRQLRALKMFAIADQLADLAGSYDDQARALERAARAAQEAARLHEAAAMKAYTSARYLRSQLVDVTRGMRELAVDEIGRATRMLEKGA